MHETSLKKVLYIAPRFHTNQYYLVKEYKERGIDVNFWVQYCGKTEDYSLIEPEILDCIFILKLIAKINRRIKSNTLDIYGFERKYSIPNPIKFYYKLKKLNPNVVIIRERSLLCMMTYILCQILGIKTILYNQSPLYKTISKENLVNKMIKWGIYKLTPKYRITPVLGDEKGEMEKNTYYLPFVISLNKSKSNIVDNKRLNLLCIGKFQERKNHLLLLQCFNDLIKKYNLYLTIVGEKATKYNENYYNKVKSFIKENNLENYVEIKENIEYKHMTDIYIENDLFILPSRNETAGYSLLEAMACGLPVICSDTNGTKCYIEEDRNGYVFSSDSVDDLRCKIEMIICDQEKMFKMGKRSLEIIQRNHNFEQYLRKIEEIIDQY